MFLLIVTGFSGFVCQLNSAGLHRQARISTRRNLYINLYAYVASRSHQEALCTRLTIVEAPVVMDALQPISVDFFFFAERAELERRREALLLLGRRRLGGGRGCCGGRRLDAAAALACRKNAMDVPFFCLTPEGRAAHQSFGYVWTLRKPHTRRQNTAGRGERWRKSGWWRRASGL